METKLLIQWSQNRSELETDISQKSNKTLSVTSVYLPPKESEYLAKALAKGITLQKYLNYLLVKHKSLLHMTIEKNSKARKRIQTKLDPKTRFAFRPKAEDWIEIQLISFGYGISCGIVILEMIRLEMNEALDEFYKVYKVDAIATFTDDRNLWFTITFKPLQQILVKTFHYRPGITVHQVPC